MDTKYKEQHKKLGLNMAYYRKMHGLTQVQLAKFLDIDRSHISAIELGKVRASVDVLFDMCDVLRIEPKDLFDFRD